MVCSSLAMTGAARPHMWYYYSGDNFGRKEPQLVSFYERDVVQQPHMMVQHPQMMMQQKQEEADLSDGRLVLADLSADLSDSESSSSSDSESEQPLDSSSESEAKSQLESESESSQDYDSDW